jgi:hypothetical protein
MMFSAFRRAIAEFQGPTGLQWDYFTGSMSGSTHVLLNSGGRGP